MVAQQVPVQQPVPAPQTIAHPGMTAAWFDDAVRRSFEKDLTIVALGSGRYAMRSSRFNDLDYLVSAHECSCDGHRRFGRCYHRARAIFEDWLIGNEPEPSAPAAIPIRLGGGADRPVAAIGPGRRCPGCGGNGRQRVHDEDGVITIEQCLICRGSGWIAAPGERQPARVLGIPSMRYSRRDAYDHRTCAYCLGDGYCCERPATAKPLPPKAA